MSAITLSKTDFNFRFIWPFHISFHFKGNVWAGLCVCFCCSQVSQVFDLESSACLGELLFMECYKEVLVELERVEQNMESQSMSSSSSSSEGLGMAAGSGTGRCRLGSSGRSTLQAIGSAAAAGFIFYICFSRK